jgi:hypothetical protein
MGVCPPVLDSVLETTAEGGDGLDSATNRWEHAPVGTAVPGGCGSANDPLGEGITVSVHHGLSDPVRTESPSSPLEALTKAS